MAGYEHLPIYRDALNLAVHFALHLKSIKELKILRSFRKLRETDALMQSDDFETHQYEIIAEQYGIEADKVRQIVMYWMIDRPLRYVAMFRDKNLIALVKKQHDKGAKIIVYSDYPAKQKLSVMKNFEADNVFCSSDAEIITG